MALPPKRSRQRSGIMRGPQREWPKHRRFVRSHGCCVPGCQDGPIEAHHMRSSANAGTGLKPHDRFLVSLCAAHHRELDDVSGGIETFQRRYGIDLWALAEEFARRSTDQEMRRSLKDNA